MLAKVISKRTSLTVLSLLAFGAMAQDDFTLEAAPEEKSGSFVIYDSEVDFGVGYTTSDSYKFRQYNGLPSEGPFADGNVMVRGRVTDEADAPNYFNIVGTNLGLTSRYLRGEYGNQGDYSVYAEYDQTPNLQFNDGSTPYIGTGGSNLTLPGGWVTSNTTAGLTNLLPDLATFDVETERRDIGAGFTKIFNRQWNFSLSYNYEQKQGTDVIGSVFATNGGNTAGATLAEPIDFKNNEIDLALNFAGEKGQFRIGYEFSYFDNNAETLQFQNAFVNAGWAAGAGFPTGVGEFALAPDNMAHNLVFSGGYNLTPRTRLTLNASHSYLVQDADLLPYTANSLLTVNTPVPRSSAEAEVNNYLFNIGVSSRLGSAWDLRGSYRFFKRDNSTPQDVFTYISADAENQPVGTANDNSRINLPYSMDQNQLKLDAGYRLMSRTKLSIGYEFDRVSRDYQEVDYTTEQTVTAKVRSNPMENVSGWLQYAYTYRDNSGYQGNAPFIDSHTPEYLATLPPSQQYENDPNLRKYYLAELSQNAIRGVLTYVPAPAWGLTLDADWAGGDFNDSPVGLQSRDILSTTFDASYSPHENFNAHAFFTYDNAQYDQLGCQFNNVPPAAVNQACILAPPASQRQWTADTNNSTYTAGIGGEWQINKKWKFGLDYMFAKGTTDIDVSGGSELQPLYNLPQLDSTRHRLGLRLNYQLRDSLRLQMSYLYEHLDSDDFALDGVEPNSVAQLITLGNQSPSYDAHVFGIALAYRFD